MKLEFEKIKRTNPVVYKILEAGGSLEDVIIGLDEYIHESEKKLLHYMSIAPRRYQTDRGIMLWVCPDEFIPLEDLRQK